MAELDIFRNTLEELFGNSLSPEIPTAEEPTTYYIITSNAKGGAASPFTGDTAQVKEVTEAELKKIYQDSGQIQDHFKSFDNYKQYIVESQDWVQSADWMNAEVTYDPTSDEFLYENREDVMYAPGEREQIQQQIKTDLYMAKMSAWYNWLGEGKELMDKWGLNNTIYNNDGDQFKWTGSGYQKTIKVDDHADFGDYLTAVMKTVITSMITGAVFNAALANVSVSNIAGAIRNALPKWLQPAITNISGTTGTLTGTAGKTVESMIMSLAEAIKSGAIVGGVTEIGTDTDAIGDIVDTYSGQIIDSVKEVYDQADDQGVILGDPGTYDPSEDVPEGPLTEIPNWRIYFPDTGDTGGGGATGGTPEGSVDSAEDVFVYDPEHDFIYRGNGVFEQIGKDGTPTGTTWEDPSYKSEEEYNAIIGEAYSVPSSAAEGPLETTTEGSATPTTPTEPTIIPPVIPDFGDTSGSSDAASSGTTDVGGAAETGDVAGEASGTSGTGTEGAGDSGIGTDGTGEGDGGDGEGDGEEQQQGDQAAASGLLSGGYKPSPLLSIAFDVPEIIPVQQSLNQNWASSLYGLEKRLGLFEGVV